jgi:SHS2 domain-containing protein
MYETFEHIADIGVRGYGKTMEESFCNCAKAFFSIMFENFDEFEPENTIELEVESVSYEGLLVKWLNKLLAVSEIEGMVFSEFEITIHGFGIKSRAKGVFSNKHSFISGTGIKGATFCEAKVIKTDDKFISQCVVDV